MSDHTLNQTRPNLNYLIWRMKKLNETLNQLDILTYRYKQLSAYYEQLSIQSQELVEAIDQIDVAVFKVRQDFDQMKEVWERIDSI